MKKRLSYPIMLVMFSMGIHGLYAQQKAKDNKVLSVERNKKDNSPTSIYFAPGANLPVANAQEILKEYLRFDPEVVRMQLSGTTTTKQNILVNRYTEYVKGIKVEFSSYSLMSKGGVAQFMTGNFYNVQNNPSTEHKLPETAGLEVALKKIGAEKYMWQVPGMERNLKNQTKDPDATYYPKANLVWIEDRSGIEPDRKLHLAYGFNIYAQKPLSRNMVYVDANTGKILFVNQLLQHTGTGTSATASSLYSGSVSILTAHIGSEFLLNDSTRGGGVNTYNMNNTFGSVVTEFTNSTTTWPSEAGIDAHWGAANVYDYWSTVQGRNSFDDEGATINSYVHVDVDYNNAFWDGTAMYYGDGSGIAAGGFSPLTSQDICAHEIGHAICQYTAGLVYAGESGAMNEGFSDIWGAVVENWSNPMESDAVAKNIWALGEEVGANPLRRMDTPSLRGDPNSYNGTNWINVVGCSPGEANDQCGVHTNSGVLNHWFYFLSQGGAGTNENGHAYSVTGVGIGTAADIAYNTELALSSTADYALCRTTSIYMASIMYGACSAEAMAVRNAWYAVGVFSSEDSTAEAGTVTGPATACIGTAVTMANATSGGSWISQHPTVATVNSSGVVTPLSPGAVTIFYFVSGDCGIVSAGKTITVNAVPTDISASPDSSAICPGSNVKLKIVSPGILPITTHNFNSGLGSWTVDNTGTTSLAPEAAWQVHPDGYIDELGEWHSPDASSFVQTNSDIGGDGVTTETKLISPVFSLAGYTNSVLAFQHTYSEYFTDLNVEVDISTDGGSSWSVLHDYLGVSAGTPTEFASETVDLSAYDGMSNLRIRYYYKTVYGWYWAIDNVTIGVNTILANHATWSPTTALYTNAALTTVYTGGTVDSVYAAPTSNITYTGTVTNIYGCSASRTSYVSINGTAPISGPSTVCAGAAISLSDTTAGGSWSSSNVTVATVGSTGIVAGVSGGTAAISYIVTASCGSTYAVKIVTVNSLPAAISGATTVCVASTTTLTSSPAGGVWSNTGAEATVNATTGVVTGVSAGTNTITYTAASSCSATLVVTVNSLPDAITGTPLTCVGSSTTLSSATSGGMWTSSNTSRATVGTGSGVVTGISIGTVDISYTLAGGCRRKVTVTVQSTPSTITGSLTVCVSSTTALGSATAGGTWSSSDGGVATVNTSTGVVTGVGTGTATISYSNGSCGVAAVVTVNAALSANTGTALVCVGQGASLSNAVSGGTWGSSNTAIATVHASTGLVTAVSTGTANITYSLGAGCFTATEVTVNAAMASIGGTPAVCVGATTTLTHSSSGGTWSSSNTTKATVIPATGVVSGVASGTATITYTLSAGCYRTATITVNTPAATISGTSALCEGSSSTLTSSTSGGTWSSSVPSNASVTSGGVVAGLVAGTTIISYQLPTGCAATRTLTVIATPGAIGGTPSVCIGGTTTLTSSPGGGNWSSSNTARATVGAGTGVVTGISTGTATIIYALSAGCSRSVTLTVNALPGAITGPLTLCATCTSTLSSTTGGGVWSSTNPAAATIDAGTGVVTGAATGTTTISYVASGCSRTAVLTVNAASSPSTGTPVVCVGQTNSTLGNPVAGGTWSSSNTAMATVHATTGLLTGISVGNPNITYTTSPGIYTVTVATVSAAVANITGTAAVCPGNTTLLANITSSGLWSSSNTARATVVAGTGVVTGVASGTATISYTVNVGCYKTRIVTVNSVPTSIGGSATVVNGASTTLSCSPGGGTWTSANPAIASVGAGTGVVTGVSIAATTITYTLSTGCRSTRGITVVAARPTFGGPVTDNAAAGIVRIYPNPTSGTLTIEAPVSGSFTVYTIDGKQVEQYTVTTAPTTVSLPANMATGIYMCRFNGADGSSAIVRLVYEH